MAIYKPYCLQFHADADGAAVNLPDVTSRNWKNDPTIDAEVTAGNISPTFISFMARKVLGELSTYAIKDALDVMGAKGYGIKSTSNPGVTWYEQQYDDCGEPVSGSNHRSILTSLGRALPDSIEVDHQGNAKLNFRVIPIKKTGVDIIVKSDVAALPSITITSARWTIGKLTLAGTVLDRYESLRLDFGNTAEGRSTKSDIDDTLIDHSSHVPKLEVRGIDPTWFDAALGIGGAAMAHADTIFYLRKRSQDSSNFVADVTAEHIKFTMYGLGAVDDILSGGEINRPTETSIVLTGAVDSSGNDPMSVNTASAIT